MQHSDEWLTADARSVLGRATQASPSVWIGSWDNARDPQFLRSERVQHVLNMGLVQPRTETQQAWQRMGITYRHIRLDTEPEAPLRDTLVASYTTINSAVRTRQCVLVFCEQGLCNAPATVAHYIMRVCHEQSRPARNILPTILAALQTKRPDIDIHFGALEQLEDAESQLTGRPVEAASSLSTRRNIARRAAHVQQMRRDVVAERAAAESTYATVRSDRL